MHGIRLPDSLLQEMRKTEGKPSFPSKAFPDLSEVNSGQSYRYCTTSRKKRRQQDRIDCRKRKAEFHSTRKQLATNDRDDIPQSKRVKENDSKEKPSSTHPVRAHEQKLEREDLRTQPRRVAQIGIVPKFRSQTEVKEDAYITYLEAKLGYKGKKSEPGRVEDDDGLGDLLDFADAVGGLGGMTPLTRHVESKDGPETDVSDDETGALKPKRPATKLEYSEDEWSGISISPDEDVEVNNSPAQPSAEPPAHPEQGTGRYIPPQLRKPGDFASENLKLTKLLKGLLNRMSEQNLATILDGIEEAYRTFRRHDVTSTLTKLIISGISSHSGLSSSYVVLHAAFVACMHRLIGVEFGTSVHNLLSDLINKTKAAFFLQKLILEYECRYASHQAETGKENVGKEVSNLIVLVSELYNFQVISSVLVYDIIRSLLLNDLQELDVELLLKLLRNSGQRLRQDDPSALKDVITIVHKKVAGNERGLSSRTHFMLETLMNLKNNKLKREKAQTESVLAIDRLTKFLSGLGKKRHLLAYDALQVSLEDLHSAESKGKWWLVGAGWAGDPQADRAKDGKIPRTSSSVNDVASERLLKLAKKQGMNTDIRRSIFVVLMSSDDYIHACEQLKQLNLTEVQQREIVRVLLHCCQNEKMYNPYYALVCEHLCQAAHAYRITLQFCLWDFLRDLGEPNIGGEGGLPNLEDGDSLGPKDASKLRLRNVAKAYGWWIAKHSVTLTILKPVDFTVLRTPVREFLRELLINVFISSQAISPAIDTGKLQPTTRNRAAVQEIFIKGTRIEALAMGLVYLMGEMFSNFSNEDEELAKLVIWASRVARDTLRTGLDIEPMIKD